MQGSCGRFEVHCRVRWQYELQSAPAPDLSGREEGAGLGQQHRERAGGSGAAIWPKDVEQDRALNWLRTVGGKVGDQQSALSAGKPRLGRLPVDHDGESPAQLDLYHVSHVRYVSAIYLPR